MYKRHFTLLSLLCTALCVVLAGSVAPAYAVSTSVTINFTDRNGNSIPVPVGAGGSVQCYASPSGNYLGNVSFGDNDTSALFEFDIDVSTDVACYFYPGGDFLTGPSNNQYTFAATPGGSHSFSASIIQKDAVLNLAVLDPTGAAVTLPTGAIVSIWCSTTTAPQRSLGAQFAAEVTSGSVALVSGWEYRCYADISNAPSTYYSSRTDVFTASASSPTDKTVVVAPQLATLELNLRNQNSSSFPLAQGEWVSASCESSTVQFSSSQNFVVGESSLTMSVPAGVSLSCTVTNRQGYETPAAITVTPTANNTTTLNFDYQPYAQGIALSLSSGSLPFNLPAGSSLDMSCWQQGPAGYNASTSVEVGASSVQLALPVGVYNCNITASETLAVSPQSATLTVTAGEDTSYSVTVVHRDAQATISLHDTSGATFTVPNNTYGSVVCQTAGNSPVTYSKSLGSGDSSAVVKLVSGLTYTCRASLYDQNVSPPVEYTSTQTQPFVASVASPYTDTVALARIDAQLSVNLRDSAGNLLPAASMEWVQVSCQASGVSFSYNNSISSGQSSVTIAAPSGTAVTCTAASRSGYQPPQSVTLTPSANQTTDVDIVYIEFPQKVQFNLSDGTGPFLLPVGKTMSMTCYRSTPTYYSVTVAVQEGASSAYIALPTGSFSCSLTNVSNNLLVNPMWANVTVAADQTVNYNVTVTTLDAQVAVQLVDNVGNPFNAPGVGASVSCQRTAGNQTRWIQIGGNSNQGSAYVQANTSYSCTAPSRDGYVASPPQTVNVASGEIETLTFVYTELAQSLTVNLQDKDGNPIPAPNSSASVSCYQPGGGGSSYWRQFAAGASSKTFAIAAGTYSCSVSNVIGFTALSSKNVTITEGNNATIAFTLFSVDSSILVNLKDSAGNDVPASGWANVWCSASGDGFYFSFSGSFASGESSKSISVIGGYSYWCNVSSFGNYSGGSFSVSVPTGEEIVQNVTLLEKNATLQVALVDKTTGEPKNIPPGTGSGYVGCYSNSGSGSASGQIPEGENTVELLTTPGDYRCWANIAGFNVPWMDKTVRTRANETVQYTIPVEQKDSTIILNFKAANGDALPVPANSQWPSASCWSRDGSAWASLNVGETSRELQVVGDRNYLCDVYGFNGYVSGRASVTVGANASVSADVVMQALDAEITVSLVTGSDSGAPYVVPDGVSASAYCYSDTFSNYGSIAAGLSSVTFKVLGGRNYTCSAWLPGMATAPRAGEVALNGALTVSIPVINPNVSATVRLVDQGGNVVENAESVSVGAYSATDEYYYGTSAPFSNGVATLDLVANGSYHLYTWSTNYMQSLYGLIKAGDNYYLPTRYSEDLQTPGSGSVQKDILVRLADATLQVSADNAQGWADVRPSSDNSSEERPSVGGSVSAAGLSIPLPNGTYEVFFWPNTESVLIPKSQTFTISAGATQTINFELTAKDHDVQVTATGPAGVSGYYWCNAYTESGLTSYGWGAQFGESAQIGISSAVSTWTVSCQGYSDDQGKLYKGEAIYTVPAGITGSLALVLEDAGALLNAKATGSSDAAITVAADEDTKLTAEQGTFAAGLTVDVTMDNKGNAPSTQTVDPAQVYDFTATNNNDQTAVTAQQGVTVQLPLNADEQVYNYTSTGGYQPAPTTEVQESNQSLALFSFGAGKIRAKSTRVVNVTVSKEAFNSGVLVVAKSKNGGGGGGGGGGGATPTPTPAVSPTATPAPPEEAPLPGNPGQSAPSAPQGFKIAKVKAAGKGAPALTATWSAVAGATGYELIITLGKKQVRKLTVNASAKPSVKFPKLSKGKYTVTLRATNAAGSSPPVTQKLTV